MPLAEQEAELPLNGGMSTKEQVDLQDSPGMRLVENLRWNDIGELQKRPAVATSIDVSLPALSAYVVLGADALIPRRGSISVLTSGYGLASYISQSSESLAYQSAGYPLRHSPVPCSVSRQIVERSQWDGARSGLICAASAVYATTTLVIAWVDYSYDSSVYNLRMKAIDLVTGAVISALDFGGINGVHIQACEYLEVGSEGVLITASNGAAAPYTVKAYRYTASTRAFTYVGDLTASAARSVHAVTGNGANFLFAFEDNASGFMTVQRRTVGSVLATHNATHGMDAGAAIAVNGSEYLIASATSTTAYAERFGSAPFTVATAGTAAYISVAIAQESRPGYVLPAWVVVGTKKTSTPSSTYTTIRPVEFNGTPAGIAGVLTIPHALPVAGGFQFDGRAYCGFAINRRATTEKSTSSLIVARLGYDTAGAAFRADQVARLCHDRFAWVGESLVTLVPTQSNSLVGSKLYVAALADFSADDSLGSQPYPQSLFLSTVDLGARPQPYVETDGVTMVASGIVWEWDGDIASEHQPIDRPLLKLVTSVAGTTSTSTGISYVAIYTWYDAQGRLHRSAPSDSASTGVITLKRIDVYVSQCPFAAYDGATAPRLGVELYATTDGGSTYYLAYRTSAKDYPDTIANPWYEFTDTLAGDASEPQLYSTGADGSELVSEPPPAMRSLAVVGDRVWGVDAEDRSRIWFSKPIVAGYAAEWNTACTLTIGDQGVAIVDVNGTPAVLGERGVWRIDGEGPNANGFGAPHAARRLPHEVECLDPLSVCKTPLGVVFRGRRGVYLLDAGFGLQPIGLPIDPSVRVGDYTGYTRVIYDERHNEIRVLDSANGLFVYNVIEQKWSKWTQDDSGTGQYLTDQCVVKGRVWYLYADLEGTLQLRREKGVDEATWNSSAEGWRLTTPWIKLAGLGGDVRLWRVCPALRLQASPASAGVTLTMRLYVDGSDTAVQTVTWSGSELAAQATSAVAYLRTVVAQQKCRTFKVDLQETSSGAYVGSIPLGVRLEYGVTPGSSKRVVATSALKG